jgi:hypothetical protein
MLSLPWEMPRAAGRSFWVLGQQSTARAGDGGALAAGVCSLAGGGLTHYVLMLLHVNYAARDMLCCLIAWLRALFHFCLV